MENNNVTCLSTEKQFELTMHVYFPFSRATVSVVNYVPPIGASVKRTRFCTAFLKCGLISRKTIRRCNAIPDQTFISYQSNPYARPPVKDFSILFFSNFY